MDADLGGYVEISHRFGVQNLEQDDVRVRHIAVIDDIILPAKGVTFIRKRNLLVCHINLQNKDHWGLLGEKPKNPNKKCNQIVTHLAALVKLNCVNNL